MKTLIKFTLLLTIIHLIGNSLYAQYSIIDSNHPGVINIPVHDTTITVGNNENATYSLDIDQDQTIDIVFHLDFVYGSQGGYEKVSATPQNNFKIHQDTTSLEYVRYYDMDLQKQIDTTWATTTAKLYSENDTIFTNENSSDDLRYLHHYSWGLEPGPISIYNNIDVFNNETGYLGFTKVYDNHETLYWIKMHVSCCSIHIIDAFTNDPYVSIGEYTNTCNVYPNPTNNILNLGDEFSNIEIYDLHGKLLIFSNNNGSMQRLNLSHLKAGFYVIKMKKGDLLYSSKFMKI